MTDGNRELVEQIFQDARFVGSLGIELQSFGRGWCETTVKVSPVLQQQHGYIHAGVLMTIADHTCGGAAASTVVEDRDVITVENKTSFLRPATASDVSCRAEVLCSGKNLVFVEAAVTAENKEGRVLIAKASSTLAVIPRLLRNLVKAENEMLNLLSRREVPACIFSWRPDNSQADIWYHDLRTGKERAIACTEEEEYQPNIMPDGGSLSVVKVERDLVRHLWRVPLGSGEGSALLSNLTSVAYYTWVDSHTLGLYLTEPDATSIVLAIADHRQE